MSVAELYYGAEKSTDPTRNQSAIEGLLLTLHIVQPGPPILKRFRRMKAEP